MKILGIHSSHDSGAAIIENGKIIAAVNEERLIRKKLFWGFPTLSIKEVMRISNTRPEEIEYVAVANLTHNTGANEKFEERNIKRKIMDKLGYFPSIFGSHSFAKFYRTAYSLLKKEKSTTNYIRRLGIKAPIKFIEHHECHAASAYYTSRFDKDTLVVTTDGSGDGYCATLNIIDSDYSLKRVAATPFFHSPASIYGYCTHNLGFTAGKHEGKLTGLAAYGKANKTYNIFKNIISVRGMEYRSKLYPTWGYPAAAKLHALMIHKKWDDIAAGLQKISEDVAVKLVSNALAKYRRKNIALAGGLFANVRINQKIAEINGVEKIYIHPHMGDGGLAVGAALSLWADLLLDKGVKPKPIEIDNAYFGTEFSDEEIEKELVKAKLKYKYYDNVEPVIAQFLKDKKIVGRFNGKMEYGPRALGNRSILADPTNKSINDWLNKRLNRTEFMPFAPSIMKEYAKDFYNNFDSGEIAAQFMTVTFDVKPVGVKKAGAVSHIDNTARPQTVTKEQNKSYYDTLKIYNELTGLPIFVNTSFNMHEEPIIWSPYDAIRAFNLGSVDILALGNYIVESKK